MIRQIKKSGAKKKINVSNAVVHIKSTFNNTIVNVANVNGETLSWSSAGASGFKGSKKGTPFAAQTATEKLCKQIKDFGIKQVEVMVSGPGSGRETAIRTLQTSGVEITLIRDMTPLPHNGCRPPKKRRV